MTCTITRKAFDGVEKVVFTGALSEAAGYFCAIVTPNVHRRDVEHSLRFGPVHSFTAGGPECMYSVRLHTRRTNP